MKSLRRIVRNGNSSHVSIPRDVLEYLRWRAGDPLIVEVTERMTLEVRPPNVTDLRSPGLPMTLEGAAPGVRS